jgi:hypothetical protein
MIRVQITPEQIQRAEGLYPFGSLKDSITKGESNIYGALGEVIVHDYLMGKGKDVKIVGDVNFDIVSNGKKIDVKTKRTTVPPIQTFNCSISAHNTRQECDYYVFVRVMEDKSEAWITGYMDKAEFYKKAKFYRKGQADPTMPSWKFAADCYNLEISKLQQL